MDDLVYSSVLALAKLSEARDEDTGDHLVRMSQYVDIIAKALSIIKEGRGKHFDPDIVAAMISSLDQLIRVKNEFL